MDFTENDVKTWKRADAGGVYYVKIPGQTSWKSSGQTVKKKAIEWALREASGGVQLDATFLDYTKDFFVPYKCPIVARLEARGGVNTIKHWDTLRQLLTDYLWPKWGQYLLVAISPKIFFAWLSSTIMSVRKERSELPISAALKNKILVVMNMVFDNAVFDGVLDSNRIRSVPRILNQGKPREIFTQEELGKLFPDDEKALLAVWDTTQLAALYLVLYDTGLRPGEACALQWKDYHSEFKAFLSYKAVDSRGLIKDLKTAKKGVKKKPALVSDRTAKLLKSLRGAPEDYLFQGELSPGKPLRVDSAGKLFLRHACRVIGLEGRTLYSLRHGANTRFRSELGDDKARELMGHTTEAMTEHYDHPEDREILRRARK